MLKYNGSGFVRGVPSRDMTEQEAEKYGIGRLLKSGAFDRIREKKIKEPVIEQTAHEEVDNAGN